MSLIAKDPNDPFSEKILTIKVVGKDDIKIFVDSYINKDNGNPNNKTILREIGGKTGKGESIVFAEIESKIPGEKAYGFAYVTHTVGIENAEHGDVVPQEGVLQEV